MNFNLKPCPCGQPKAPNSHLCVKHRNAVMFAVWDSPEHREAERFLSQTTELPAFKITYADGSILCTSMAKNISLDMAEMYFVGSRFDIGNGFHSDGTPKENIQEAIKVEELPPLRERGIYEV